jgi:2-dehydropantoate 2-reductase
MRARAGTAATAQRWHLLGAGAIGTLFAYQLQRAGCEVTLLRRSAADCRRPPELSDALGTHSAQFRQLPATHSDRIDYLLLCTKAFDIEAALHSVRAQLHPATRVVVLANGMGFEAQLAALLPRQLYLRAMCTEGAWRDPDRPHRIVHAGRGHTLIGTITEAAGGPAPQWFAEGLGQLPRCSWEPDMHTALWRKFALNCTVNALTAVHHCRNGELLSNPTLKRALRAVCEEVQAACVALNQGRAVQDLWPHLQQVLQATAANQSSMLQDVLHGRRTEIDYLNGFLLQRAGNSSALPLNRALLERVRALSCAGDH